MPSLARLMWFLSAPARASLRGRSAAPMYVKYIGENSASPSRPDQYYAFAPIEVVIPQEQFAETRSPAPTFCRAGFARVYLWAADPRAPVIPAKAGMTEGLDSRPRGNDDMKCEYC
jgi:hypothetical protein